MRAAAASQAPATPLPFPWEDALALGLTRLRLNPDAFWRLTPRELLLMAGLGRKPDTMDRAALEELMARFGG